MSVNPIPQVAAINCMVGATTLFAMDIVVIRICENDVVTFRTFRDVVVISNPTSTAVTD